MILLRFNQAWNKFLSNWNRFQFNRLCMTSISMTMKLQSPLSAELLPPQAVGGVSSLTVYEKRKVWQFPRERFVTYEPSDEPWCRYFGIGREVEVIESLEFPHAVIQRVEDGAVEIRAIPAPVEERLNVYSV